MPGAGGGKHKRKTQDKIAKAGGIGPLLQLVESPNAAGAISSSRAQRREQAAIARTGAIAALHPRAEGSARPRSSRARAVTLSERLWGGARCGVSPSGTCPMTCPRAQVARPAAASRVTNDPTNGRIFTGSYLSHHYFPLDFLPGDAVPMAAKGKGVTPANAKPAQLIDIFKGHALKSVRLTLACLKRWEELEHEGKEAGLANIRELCEAEGPAAVVAAMNAHAAADVALAERGCRALATISHGVLENFNNKEAVINADGLRSILAAMAAHEQTAAVQIKGWSRWPTWLRATTGAKRPCSTRAPPPSAQRSPSTSSRMPRSCCRRCGSWPTSPRAARRPSTGRTR